MLITVAVLATLGFVGWLIFRAVKTRQVRAHHVTYGITIVTSIYTYAFFLSMSFPVPIKVIVSIIMGIALIVIAAYLQRRRGIQT